MIASVYNMKEEPAPSLVHEEPWGEQFFPGGLSRYAPERTRGVRKNVARQIRANPWWSIGFGLLAGVGVGFLARQLLNVACSGGKS